MVDATGATPTMSEAVEDFRAPIAPDPRPGGVGVETPWDAVSQGRDALTRSSYWTYQRLAAVLDGQSGRVVLPEAPAGFHVLDRTAASSALTILEFPGSSRNPYLYVIFADSAAAHQIDEKGKVTPEGIRQVSVQANIPLGTHIRYYPLIPSRTTIAGVASRSSSFTPEKAAWADVSIEGATWRILHPTEWAPPGRRLHSWLPGTPMDPVNFFDAHQWDWLVLFGLAVFPRLTLLFVGGPFGILHWLGWLVAPHLLVAILATTTYWSTNPVLCVFAWFFAFAGSGTEGRVVHGARRRWRDRKD